MRVKLSDAASNDLTEIGLYVAADNPEAAQALVRSLRDKTRDIGAYPAAFPVMSRHRAEGIRRKPCGSYLIFYTVLSDEVLVVRIIHAARDYAALLQPPDL